MKRNDPPWQYFPPEVSETPEEDEGGRREMTSAAPTNEFSDELSRLMGFDCSHILPGMQFNLSTDRWEYPPNPQPTFAPVGEAEIDRMFRQPPNSLLSQNSPDQVDHSSIHSLDGPFSRANSSLSLTSTGDLADIPGSSSSLPDYQGVNSVLETLLPQGNLNFNPFEDFSRSQQISDDSAADANIPVRGNRVNQESHAVEDESEDEEEEGEDAEDVFAAGSPRLGSPESFANTITAPENFCWINRDSDEQDDDST